MSNSWPDKSSNEAMGIVRQALDIGDAPSPTPGAAAMDASITIDGTVRIALESDGQGVAVQLTVHEFLQFCVGGIGIVAQYHEAGLMERVSAGQNRGARRIIR